MVSSAGKAIMWDEGEVRAMGRDTMGVRGMNVPPIAKVLGMEIAQDDTDLFVITEKGYGKRTSVAEYPEHHRGGQGVFTITMTEKKGLLAALPSAYTEGAFYVTTDERALYLDVDGSTRIRIGDFQEFANLEALQANTNPSTTALYYIADINVLAKWNGTNYIQINLDTGATSIEVTGDGNAVTVAAYDAGSRKITLTKGATYVTSAEVSSAISAAIGDLGNNDESVPYATVKEYVDDKVADIVAGSIEGLGALAAKDQVAEADLESALAAKINGKADQTTVDTLVGADTGKSVRTIANEELAAQLIPEGAQESLNTLQEIAQWIQDHPDDAAAMNTAIEALETKVDTGEQTVSAAIAALNIGDYATAAALTAVADRVTTLEGASHTHANKAELDKIADGDKAKWDAAEQNAKAYTDTALTWGSF